MTILEAVRKVRDDKRLMDADKFVEGYREQIHELLSHPDGRTLMQLRPLSNFILGIEVGRLLQKEETCTQVDRRQKPISTAQD